MNSVGWIQAPRAALPGRSPWLRVESSRSLTKRFTIASHIVASASQPHQLHISYNTTWHEPIVHYSLGGKPWTSHFLQRTVNSAGQHWVQFTLDAGGSDLTGDVPVLEMVLTDGNGIWDKAPGDQNYLIFSPGQYRLSHGSLDEVSSPAVLVVSDLDDTMVGDDEATAKFTEWWRSVGVPAGGRLIYNTGRALDLFEKLIEEKKDCLAEPDLLISSVGTKIYKKGSDGAWKEDSTYTARLNKGWSLEAVREAAYSALSAVGKDSMHFRPPSEMHEHKVTCGVACKALDTVLNHIGKALDAENVAHKIIVSGSGNWQFVDLVPAAAGKLAALEYAREALGFESNQTVACGDSGNDKDMLEGKHHAIVVGNAQPDLMAWARGAQENAPLVTKGHRAHGILEGLKELGFRD